MVKNNAELTLDLPEHWTCGQVSQMIHHITNEIRGLEENYLYEAEDVEESAKMSGLQLRFPLQGFFTDKQYVLREYEYEMNKVHILLQKLFSYEVNLGIKVDYREGKRINLVRLGINLPPYRYYR